MTSVSWSSLLSLSDQGSSTVDEFIPPPVTYTGAGCRTVLHELVDDYASIHIVTDRGVLDTGFIDEIAQSLESPVTIHSNVSPNPRIDEVHALASSIADAEVVLGIGGGSPMDAAKVASVCAGFSNNVRSELAIHPDTTLSHPDRVVPCILVPTTAGTGTETGQWAVISDRSRLKKRSLGHPAMRPMAAVLDPELTTTLPPNLTASTGFDVITHALESLVATNASALTLPYSERAFELAFETIKRVTKSGDSIRHRKQMLEASYLAGVSMNNAGLGIVHAISHALGGLYDIPHGHTNALLLPSAIEFNRSRDAIARDRFDSVVSTENDASDGLSEQVRGLVIELNLDEPPPGIPTDGDWTHVASIAVDNINALTNPVPVDEEDVVTLCQRTFDS